MAVQFSPGKNIDNKYEVMEKIGNGSTGTVYKARCLSGKPPVAVKIVDILWNSHVKRRVEREIRMMQEIKHPNVILILDSGEFEDLIYIVMPLAVNSISKELGMLCKDHEKAFLAFEEICSGVQALHIGGVFHRDIKPANCLRLKDGRIVVSDLGIGRFDERDSEVLTTTNSYLGTAAYMAPEQCEPGGSRNADHRTDIFQLGKTLYHLLTHDLPMHMYMEKLPVGIRHVIAKATKQKSEERYQTVSELMDAVRLYQQAIDPNMNVRAAFENVRQIVSQLKDKGEYRPEFLSQLFGYAGRLFDENLISGLSAFDSIENVVLGMGATHSSQELTAVLNRYVAAVMNITVRSHGYDYAETVAQKMRFIFVHAEDAELRTLSLEAILIAAVSLNRFAAIDIFTVLLKKAKDEEALPISEMLRRRIHLYRTVAPKIGDGQLPLLIDQVRREAMQIGEQEKKKTPEF